MVLFECVFTFITIQKYFAFKSKATNYEKYYLGGCILKKMRDLATLHACIPAKNHPV